jgi:glycogen operon protein
VGHLSEENPLASIVKNRLREGLPLPRGATWDGNGTNFALFSANATKVEICLFDGKRCEADTLRRSARVCWT